MPFLPATGGVGAAAPTSEAGAAFALLLEAAEGVPAVAAAPRGPWRQAVQQPLPDPAVSLGAGAAVALAQPAPLAMQGIASAVLHPGAAGDPLRLMPAPAMPENGDSAGLASPEAPVAVRPGETGTAAEAAGFGIAWEAPSEQPAPGADSVAEMPRTADAPGAPLPAAQPPSASPPQTALAPAPFPLQVVAEHPAVSSPPAFVSPRPTGPDRQPEAGPLPNAATGLFVAPNPGDGTPDAAVATSRADGAPAATDEPDAPDNVETASLFGMGAAQPTPGSALPSLPIAVAPEGAPLRNDAAPENAVPLATAQGNQAVETPRHTAAQADAWTWTPPPSAPVAEADRPRPDPVAVGHRAPTSLSGPTEPRPEPTRGAPAMTKLAEQVRATAAALPQEHTGFAEELEALAQTLDNGEAVPQAIGAAVARLREIVRSVAPALPLVAGEARGSAIPTPLSAAPAAGTPKAALHPIAPRSDAATAQPLDALADALARLLPGSAPGKDDRLAPLSGPAPTAATETPDAVLQQPAALQIVRHAAVAQRSGPEAAAPDTLRPEPTLAARPAAQSGRLAAAVLGNTAPEAAKAPVAEQAEAPAIRVSTAAQTVEPVVPAQTKTQQGAILRPEAPSVIQSASRSEHVAEATPAGIARPVAEGAMPLPVGQYRAPLEASAKPRPGGEPAMTPGTERIAAGTAPKAAQPAQAHPWVSVETTAMPAAPEPAAQGAAVSAKAPVAGAQERRVETLAPRPAEQGAAQQAAPAIASASLEAASAAPVSSPPQPAAEASRPLPLPQAYAQAQPIAQVPQHVALEIARHYDAGSSRFEIRLDPPELGRIDVSLEIDKGGAVHARLTVEKAETLDLMQRDQRTLERALQQAGLDASRTSLEFSLKQHQGQQQESRQNGHGSPLASQKASEGAPEEVRAPLPASAYRTALRPGGINFLA